MKFARTGLATLGLFAFVAAGCPQPTHKKNDAGKVDEGDGGDGGDSGSGGSGGSGTSGSGGSSSGGSGGSDTGGSGGSGGSSTGGAGGDSTGGSGGAGMADAGGGKDMGGGTGGTGGGMGASMAGFMTIYTNIISKNCAPCHTTNNPPSGGLSMKDAATAFMNLVGAKGSTNCMGMTRVVPGDPSMSLLVKKLMTAPPCGAQMPKGKTPLNAATLKMITDWITSG